MHGDALRTAAAGRTRGGWRLQHQLQGGRRTAGRKHGLGLARCRNAGGADRSEWPRPPSGASFTSINRWWWPVPSRSVPAGATPMPRRPNLTANTRSTVAPPAVAMSGARCRPQFASGSRRLLPTPPEPWRRSASAGPAAAAAAAAPASRRAAGNGFHGTLPHGVETRSYVPSAARRCLAPGRSSPVQALSPTGAPAGSWRHPAAFPAAVPAPALVYVWRYRWRVGLALGLLVAASWPGGRTNPLLKQLVDALDLAPRPCWCPCCCCSPAAPCAWRHRCSGAAHDRLFARVMARTARSITLRVFEHLRPVAALPPRPPHRWRVARRRARHGRHLGPALDWTIYTILPTLLEIVVVLHPAGHALRSGPSPPSLWPPWRATSPSPSPSPNGACATTAPPTRPTPKPTRATSIRCSITRR